MPCIQGKVRPTLRLKPGKRIPLPSNSPPSFPAVGNGHTTPGMPLSPSPFTLPSILSSLRMGRSELLPEGSPTRPVAPPSSATGWWPVEQMCARAHAFANGLTREFLRCHVLHDQPCAVCRESNRTAASAD